MSVRLRREVQGVLLARERRDASPPCDRVLRASTPRFASTGVFWGTIGVVSWAGDALLSRERGTLGYLHDSAWNDRLTVNSAHQVARAPRGLEFRISSTGLVALRACPD